MNPIKLEILNRIKKEIEDKRNGFVINFKLNRDYEKEFGVSNGFVKSVLKELSKEDRLYRKSEIQSQTGQKSKGNPNYPFAKQTREEKQAIIKKSRENEQIVKVHFERQLGYKVVKIQETFFDEQINRYYQKMQYEELEKLDNYSKIINVLDECKREYNNFKIPDFVCEKGESLLFVEAGTNKPKSFRQRRSLIALRNKGFQAELWLVNENGIPFQRPI